MLQESYLQTESKISFPSLDFSANPSLSTAPLGEDTSTLFQIFPLTLQLSQYYTNTKITHVQTLHSNLSSHLQLLTGAATNHNSPLVRTITTKTTSTLISCTISTLQPIATVSNYRNDEETVRLIKGCLDLCADAVKILVIVAAEDINENVSVGAFLALQKIFFEHQLSFSSRTHTHPTLHSQLLTKTMTFIVSPRLRFFFRKMQSFSDESLAKSVPFLVQSLSHVLISSPTPPPWNPKLWFECAPLLLAEEVSSYLSQIIFPPRTAVNLLNHVCSTSIITLARSCHYHQPLSSSPWTSRAILTATQALTSCAELELQADSQHNANMATERAQQLQYALVGIQSCSSDSSNARTELLCRITVIAASLPSNNYTRAKILATIANLILTSTSDGVRQLFTTPSFGKILYDNHDEEIVAIFCGCAFNMEKLDEIWLKSAICIINGTVGCVNWQAGRVGWGAQKAFLCLLRKVAKNVNLIGIDGSGNGNGKGGKCSWAREEISKTIENLNEWKLKEGIPCVSVRIGICELICDNLACRMYEEKMKVATATAPPQPQPINSFADSTFGNNIVSSNIIDSQPHEATAKDILTRIGGELIIFFNKGDVESLKMLTRCANMCEIVTFSLFIEENFGTVAIVKLALQLLNRIYSCTVDSLGGDILKETMANLALKAAGRISFALLGERLEKEVGVEEGAGQTTTNTINNNNNNNVRFTPVAFGRAPASAIDNLPTPDPFSPQAKFPPTDVAVDLFGASSTISPANSILSHVKQLSTVDNKNITFNMGKEFFWLKLSTIIKLSTSSSYSHENRLPPPAPSTPPTIATISGCSDPLAVNLKWERTDRGGIRILIIAFNAMSVTIDRGVAINVKIRNSNKKSNGILTTKTATFLEPVKAGENFVYDFEFQGGCENGDLEIECSVVFLDVEVEKAVVGVGIGMGIGKVEGEQQQGSPPLQSSDAQSDEEGGEIQTKNENEEDETDIILVDQPAVVCEVVKISSFALLQRCEETFWDPNCVAGDNEIFYELWSVLENRLKLAVGSNSNVMNRVSNGLGAKIDLHTDEFVSVSAWAFKTISGAKLYCVLTHDGDKNSRNASFEFRTDDEEILYGMSNNVQRRRVLCEFVTNGAYTSNEIYIEGTRTTRRGANEAHNFLNFLSPNFG